MEVKFCPYTAIQFTAVNKNKLYELSISDEICLRMWRSSTFSPQAGGSAGKLHLELRNPRPIPGFWRLRHQRQNLSRETGLMNLTPNAASSKGKIQNSRKQLNHYQWRQCRIALLEREIALPASAQNKIHKEYSEASVAKIALKRRDCRKLTQLAVLPFLIIS